MNDRLAGAMGALRPAPRIETLWVGGWRGRIAEVIIYEGQHDAGVRTSIINGLQQLSGIPVAN